MKLHERIDFIVRKKCKGGRKELAELLHVKQNTFNGYFSDSRQDKFKAIHLERIIDLYPEINPAWLLTGEGEMEAANADNRQPDAICINADGTQTAFETKTTRNRMAHGMEIELSPLLTQLANIEVAMSAADDLAKIEAMIASLKGQHQALYQKRSGYGSKIAREEDSIHMAHEDRGGYDRDACSIDGKEKDDSSDRLKG